VSEFGVGVEECVIECDECGECVSVELGLGSK
jgi:hypothetical protein